ncbi:hypothetical protein FA95DRAFT_510080 [Auriscalpium vulgare]|uniref:Uncharacterized protein n=1 Tax=Auriscalpium vulgare TaxID=40419 RepID=A0ACB8RH89_9AGAM|nr:hypothetical protein FA95DRAFT_510080 [Auriscalpium vulgare]
MQLSSASTQMSRKTKLSPTPLSMRTLPRRSRPQARYPRRSLRVASARAARNLFLATILLMRFWRAQNSVVLLISTLPL